MKWESSLEQIDEGKSQFENHKNYVLPIQVYIIWIQANLVEHIFLTIETTVYSYKLFFLPSYEVTRFTVNSAKEAFQIQCCLIVLLNLNIPNLFDKTKFCTTMSAFEVFCCFCHFPDLDSDVLLKLLPTAGFLG